MTFLIVSLSFLLGVACAHIYNGNKTKPVRWFKSYFLGVRFYRSWDGNKTQITKIALSGPNIVEDYMNEEGYILEFPKHHIKE